MARIKCIFQIVVGLAVVLAGLTTMAQESPDLITLLPGLQTSATPMSDDAKPETVIERYPNGSVKVEREVIQDASANFVNHGTYTMYALDGRVLKTGEFLDGKQHGKWIQYSPKDEVHVLSGEQHKEFAGPFVSEAMFAEGKLHGAWTIKDSEGQSIIEWNFERGVPNGKWTWWHSNAKKWLEANYKDGALNGELLEWDRDGKLVAQSTYLGGRCLVKEVGWYSLGHKRYEGAFLRLQGVPEPQYDWWTGTATAKSPAETGPDQKHGVWTAWYPNGNKQSEGEYDHNSPVGKFAWWYENGQKQAEGEYEAGAKNGTWVTWHPNGLKESQVTYVDGKRIGTFMQWDTEGKVVGMRDFDPSQKKAPKQPTRATQRPSTVSQRPATVSQRPATATRGR